MTRRARASWLVLALAVVVAGVWLWLAEERVHAFSFVVAGLSLAAAVWLEPQYAPRSLGEFAARVAQSVRGELLAFLFLLLAILVLWKQSAR